MKHPDPDEMNDGMLDHRGDALPYLSKSAKNMKMEKLLSTPMPEFSGKTPGSYFWTQAIYWICNRISKVQFKTAEATGTERIPSDRGSLCCAWHTNGILDALQITLNHPKYFVLGARHDLVTRPMLGWWTRKMAVQPVVRKAELLRGGCSEEEANFLNGRSLITLASGIANGFGCVLFPEGTSHNNSYMLRFRTGPMRTVLAAGALSATLDKNLPVLIPIGLHFRQKEHFRTDVWVEYGEPIQVESTDIPQNLIDAVAGGSWSEPPAENVYQLRDKLKTKLLPLSPNVSSWEENRALHLLGHLDARRQGKTLPSWREEVLAARKFQEQFAEDLEIDANEDVQPAKLSHPILEPASQAADILHQNGLDGRDINQRGTGIKSPNLLKFPLGLMRTSIFVALLPLFIISLLPQITLGRLLGDSTDEGIDARTSYQFLAAMFGSLVIWPIAATISTAFAYFTRADIYEITGVCWPYILGESTYMVVFACIILWILMMPLFLFIGNLSSLVWDDYVALRGFTRKLTMSKDDKEKLQSFLSKTNQQLAKL